MNHRNHELISSEKISLLSWSHYFDNKVDNYTEENDSWESDIEFLLTETNNIYPAPVNYVASATTNNSLSLGDKKRSHVNAFREQQQQEKVTCLEHSQCNSSLSDKFSIGVPMLFPNTCRSTTTTNNVTPIPCTVGDSSTHFLTRSSSYAPYWYQQHPSQSVSEESTFACSDVDAWEICCSDQLEQLQLLGVVTSALAFPSVTVITEYCDNTSLNGSAITTSSPQRIATSSHDIENKWASLSLDLFPSGFQVIWAGERLQPGQDEAEINSQHIFYLQKLLNTNNSEPREEGADEDYCLHLSALCSSAGQLFPLPYALLPSTMTHATVSTIPISNKTTVQCPVTNQWIKRPFCDARHYAHVYAETIMSLVQEKPDLRRALVSLDRHQKSRRRMLRLDHHHLICPSQCDNSTENESVFKSLEDEKVISDEGCDLMTPVTLDDLADCLKDCRELLSPVKLQPTLKEQSIGSMLLLFGDCDTTTQKFHANNNDAKFKVIAKEEIPKNVKQSNKISSDVRKIKRNNDMFPASGNGLPAPSCMKEWASLLSYCSKLSSEILAMKDLFKRATLTSALIRNYKSLEETAATVGAEDLLQLHVKDRIHDLSTRE